jgi:hypothetical protein
VFRCGYVRPLIVLTCLIFNLRRTDMQVTMAWAVALFLLGTTHNANAQSLSVNPSAAASEVRNPSSINPAAAASDVRNPSAINPSARASQISGPSAISSTRPAGVAPTAPRQRAAPAPRHTPPEKSLGQASRDKRDSKSPPAAASAPVEPDRRSGEEARSRQDEQFQQWDAAAKRAIGSICDGCGGEGASPKRAQKPSKRTRKAG